MPRSFPDADPTAIGTIKEPPFAVLPDPATLFAARGRRCEALAKGSQLGPYLRFLASLAAAQDRVARGDLPEPAALDPARRDLARDHAMPPLDRAGFRRDATVDATLGRFFAEAGTVAMPEAAATALALLRGLDEDERDVVIDNVLADAVPIDAVAEHVLVAAGLQIHFARLAARLDVRTLQPVGQTLCPACGSPPVASLVVGWLGAEGTRFCACPLCATSWHFVRIRCTACGSTKGIGYREVEGGQDATKAETCGECGSYAKIFHQTRDPDVEPVADDVASLGLDILLKDSPFRRASYNPFLVGY